MAPVVVDAVLYGADAVVLAWLADRMPIAFGPCAALGVVRQGALIGGVVFNNYRPDARDIEVSAFFETGAWFRPRTVRRLLSYPFDQVGCVRLSLTTARKNRRARAFAEKAGFRLEGVKRRGIDGHQDAILFGLLREECRFLKGH